jgi:hypothetical protein
MPAKSKCPWCKTVATAIHLSNRSMLLLRLLFTAFYYNFPPCPRRLVLLEVLIIFHQRAKLFQYPSNPIFMNGLRGSYPVDFDVLILT